MKVKDAIKSCIDQYGNIDSTKAARIVDFLRARGANYNTIAEIFSQHGINKEQFENAMYYADIMGI